MGKKLLTVLLVLALAVTGASALGLDDPQVFLKQETAGECTLSSVTMLLRRKALLDLDQGWADITQEAVRQVAWSAAGLSHSFTLRGMTVSCIPRYSGWGGGTPQGKVDYLLQMLEDHPEGVVAYCWYPAHAVLLTDYDPETGIVYCAEPADFCPQGRIPLSDSLIPGADQDAQLANFQQLWYISQGDAQGAGTLSLSEEEPPADPDQDSPFQPVRSYDPGSFSDISEEDWFYDNVVLSYRLGLFQGYDTGDFRPYELLTLAQAVTLAARLHSIYHTGGEDFPPGSDHWYDGYVDYAYAHRIILEDYPLDRFATRDQFVHILASALPADQLEELREVEPFADDSAISYPQDVDLLYRAGVLNGIVTEEGLSFCPGQTVTRAEAAAILTRMARPSLRQH